MPQASDWVEETNASWRQPMGQKMIWWKPMAGAASFHQELLGKNW